MITNNYDINNTLQRINYIKTKISNGGRLSLADCKEIKKIIKFFNENSVVDCSDELHVLGQIVKMSMFNTRRSRLKLIKNIWQHNLNAIR